MYELSPAFNLKADEIVKLLDPSAPLFPELEAARQNVDALRNKLSTRTVLAGNEPLMSGIEQIPATRYTHYRLFIRTGDRQNYEGPYFDKRAKLAAAALRLFLGQAELKDIVQDYIWNICEETNWVAPAHENHLIDLFSAETGQFLGETLELLGDTLDQEVRNRVHQEVERRILDPYIRFHHLSWWYKGFNNWNGVCNGAVAATFMMLEPEQGRVARAIELALASLDVFLHLAFEEDGSSTEGPGYWGYGLQNLIVLSEMLRARSHGRIDLLQGEHMRRVAGYPPKMVLSGSTFASFSDSHEHTTYDPCCVVRLAERTGETALLDLTTYPPHGEQSWRTGLMLRNMLWWDGMQRQPAAVADAYLPSAGVARLTGRTAQGAAVVVAIKAGHNAENHNQNDVGSFIVHVDGETLLCDPGAGLYNRQYFSAERYENVFANSYGHSVPRIGEHLQEAGREYAGRVLGVESEGAVKNVDMDIARAYPLANLAHLLRTLSVSGTGTVILSDVAEFDSEPLDVEEALITWLPVEVKGATALIRGERHALHLTIEQPAGATFACEEMRDACRANQKEGLLRRITFMVPAAARMSAMVRMEIE